MADVCQVHNPYQAYSHCQSNAQCPVVDISPMCRAYQTCANVSPMHHAHQTCGPMISQCMMPIKFMVYVSQMHIVNVAPILSAY